ncbi:MAG: hypothetical protein V1650_01440 [Candidatus Omnitrophota bacterium]
MMLKLTVIVVFIGTVLLLSGNTFAESGDVAGDQPEFKAMDADSDNYVVMKEFQAYQKDSFNNFDLNKDGILDAEELNADAKGTFTGVDKNNDGQLTWEEASGSFSDYFKQMDINNDNKIDAQEYDEYWKNRIQF